MDEETTHTILARLARIEVMVRRLPTSKTDLIGLYILVSLILIQTCSKG